MITCKLSCDHAIHVNSLLLLGISYITAQICLHCQSDETKNICCPVDKSDMTSKNILKCFIISQKFNLAYNENFMQPINQTKKNQKIKFYINQ